MGFWHCFRICGGLVPVLKNDKMTQPVGVGQDGRLWTEPTGGGASNIGYCQARSSEELNADPYTFNNFTMAVADPAGRVTIDNGKIKIGDGVNAVAVSVRFAYPSAQPATYYGVELLKNGTTVTSSMRGTTQGAGIVSETFTIPMTIITVHANDVFTVKVTGGGADSDVANAQINMIIL